MYSLPRVYPRAGGGTWNTHHYEKKTDGVYPRAGGGKRSVVP